MSLKDVAAWASALEITRISGAGLHYRIRKSEAWFQSILIQVLEPTEPTPGTGLVVRIMNATVIVGPGSQGMSWRAHVSLDPDTGRILSVEITDTKGGESFCRYMASPNILDVGDRGYCAARGIYSRVSGGGHVLVRVNHHSVTCMKAQWCERQTGLTANLFGGSRHEKAYATRAPLEGCYILSQ
jgi:hypothetical protein